MKKILIFIMIFDLTLSLSSCKLIELAIKRRSNRSYTIHFNANGGEGEMDDYFVESGDDHWLPDCTFTREGYECVAWALDPDGNDYASQIDNLTFRLPLSVRNGDTVQLYAIWTTPGFSYSFGSMGYFCSWDISGYDGNSSNVIIPVWRDGNIENSGYASCRVDGLTSSLFIDHVEIEKIKNVNSTYLPNDLFNGCTSLEYIEMNKGKSIYNIGDRAFKNCMKLKSISLDNNLSTIGDEAFYMCTSIDKLVITAYLDKIGSDVFYGWTQSQTIEFTQYSSNPFGENVFNGCNANIIWSQE